MSDSFDYVEYLLRTSQLSRDCIQAILDYQCNLLCVLEHPSLAPVFQNLNFKVFTALLKSKDIFPDDVKRNIRDIWGKYIKNKHIFELTLKNGVVVRCNIKSYPIRFEKRVFIEVEMNWPDIIHNPFEKGCSMENRKV